MRTLWGCGLRAAALFFRLTLSDKRLTKYGWHIARRTPTILGYFVIQKTLGILFLALATVVLTGCRREKIRVYTAPKDPPPRQELAHGPNDGHDHGDESATAARPRPQLSWKLPDGWRESTPGRMSVATFSITSGAQE